MKKGHWNALLWITLAELFALSLWFSASAILPQLKIVWQLSPLILPWVTSSVQLGFIIGALFSSFLGIADRFDSSKVFAISAALGAVINGILLFTSDAWLGIFIRFLTGICLAGVYPTAVKLISIRYPNQKGLAIGVLIGGLTLGSALPHFSVAFLINVNWKAVIFASSILALIASYIMFRKVEATSSSRKSTEVSLHLVKEVVKNNRVMLANYGYFGHMWELYAMWTWLPAFLIACLSSLFPEKALWYSAVLSYLIIGVAGAIGSSVGGYVADKIGKIRLSILAMITSGVCAFFIGFTLKLSIWVTLLVAFIWGISIIADSAQFSALVSDYASFEYVGTALTFQMAVGFFITVVSINIIPIIQSYLGWELVFMFLSIGPFFGAMPMRKLAKMS